MTDLSEWFQGLGVTSPDAGVPRILQAFDGCTVGSVFHLENRAQAALLRTGLPPVLVPIASDDDRVFSLHSPRWSRSPDRL